MGKPGGPLMSIAILQILLQTLLLKREATASMSNIPRSRGLTQRLVYIDFLILPEHASQRNCRIVSRQGLSSTCFMDIHSIMGRINTDLIY